LTRICSRGLLAYAKSLERVWNCGSDQRFRVSKLPLALVPLATQHSAMLRKELAQSADFEHLLPGLEPNRVLAVLRRKRLLFDAILHKSPGKSEILQELDLPLTQPEVLRRMFSNVRCTSTSGSPPHET